MGNICHVLETNAIKLSEKIAVSGSRVSLTWHALNDEVVALAASLHGIRTLGLLMENAPAWVVTDLAALKADVVNIPLPGFFSDEQLRHTIRDAHIQAVITDNPFRIQSLLRVDRVVSLEIAGKQCALLFYDATVADQEHSGTVKVTYTSGTTGEPRGVQLSRGAIETVAGSLAEAAAADRHDRALVLLPLSILLENIGSLYAPVIAGAEILVPDAGDLGLSGSSHINAAVFSAFLNRARPTTMILPPQLLKLFVALARQQLLPDSFRYIAVGGAPVGITLLDEARELGLPVYQGYGLSEACSVVTVNTAESNRPGSVGKPLRHASVRIGMDGEIIVRGETFNGYLNAPCEQANAELATGDLGYLDEEGYLYVTGRMRNRIITGFGRNISPEWVESELMSHPLIEQVAVFGNDMPYLVAIVVPASSALAVDVTASIEQALQQVNERLPDYAMIGGHVIADGPFSPASGEITASGSPCHAVIERHYATQIGHRLEQSYERIL